jgi:drug/metabolite transporter (DMT)-like permease
MEALVLSLSAAVAWGVADFGAALKARQLSVFAVVGGMQLIGSIGAALFVAAARDGGLTTETTLLGLAAGAVTSVGLVTLYQGLAMGPMSLVAPISATGVVVPVIVGLAGGDSPTAAQGTGMLLAISGMLIAVRTSAEPSSGTGTRPRYAALALGAVSAIGLGVYYLTVDAVDDGQGAWFSLLGQLTACAILMLLVVVRRVAMPSRADLRAIAVLGVVSFAAWILSQAAFDAGHLSLTATIISMYSVVTILLAVAVAREAVPPAQALGLVAVFGGVALIAAG